MIQIREHGLLIVFINDSDFLNVCVPFSSGVSHGVRNIVAGNLSLTADFAFL